MSLRLLIGNKNYSSWSLRPWLAMKAAGIDFEETLIPSIPGLQGESIRPERRRGQGQRAGAD